MKSKFIHLRVHTEYSLVDGIVRIKPLINALRSNDVPAVAITDETNLFAAIKFYKSCTSAGIKPIIGSDIWLKSDHYEEKLFRITLLVQSDIGYRNLIAILSHAYLVDRHHIKPAVNFSLIQKHSEGLIVLSGGREGEIGHTLLSDQKDKANLLLTHWMKVFPDNFYLELQRTGRPQEEEYLHAVVSLAESADCPVVATNDVCFLSQDDFEAHETRVCINEGRILTDPKRIRRYSEQQYLRSVDEMEKLFSDIPAALDNTVEIAKRCNFQLKFGDVHLPNYPVPEGTTLNDYLVKVSAQGLEERLAVVDNNKLIKNKPDREIYNKRLQFELDIIMQMGFSGYFLIVMDFILWAKQHDIPVGPGRGSGAGSIVAYALSITDLDPIEYDLLFERFLNPERVSMPDFDIDFCMDGRDRVIEYVAEKYGNEAVSQIITFGTMAAKAVVRDVARVQGKPYGFADKIAKLIPFELGMTLDKAMVQEVGLRDFYESNDEVKEVIDMAFKLEGITRNVGKHAGGVVIAPSKLTDFAPLYCDENSGALVTQYDKDDVEQVGLVKFDFLGLRTLTIIDHAVKTINGFKKQANEALVNINQIPLDDKATFTYLQQADSTAIFQLESRGMKDLIKRLQPSSFEEITALVALFRPGPLQSGMVDDFINRKHGRAKVEYSHPELEPILQNTYGVILYQEQVMKIAQVLAGYTLGHADLLRRAMGKKKAEEMAKQRKFFTDGAIKHGVSEKQATYIFDLMEKFAGYGFNKSHSAAYALLAYQTAWLKKHYPASFMAAVLSADMQNTDKIVLLIDACKSMELKIILPNINLGCYRFTVNQENHIIYGLGAIKGIGESPVSCIEDERERRGVFSDLYDFCQRIDLKCVTRKTIETLIRTGAFDEFSSNRALLMNQLDKAIGQAEQHNNNQKIGINDLFADEKSMPAIDKVDVDSIKPWSAKIRLQYEKETLGLYLTGHPYDEYTHELQDLVSSSLAKINTSDHIQILAGVVSALRMTKNRRGESMAYLTLDDKSARIDVLLFPVVYEQYKECLIKDTLLIIEGMVSHDNYTDNLKIQAKRVLTIMQVREERVKYLLINLNEIDLSNRFTHQLANLLQQNENGVTPILVQYQNKNTVVDISLGKQWQVYPDDVLLHKLAEEFGDNAVSLVY